MEQVSVFLFPSLIPERCFLRWSVLTLAIACLSLIQIPGRAGAEACRWVGGMDLPGEVYEVAKVNVSGERSLIACGFFLAGRHSMPVVSFEVWLAIPSLGSPAGMQSVQP